MLRLTSYSGLDETATSKAKVLIVQSHQNMKLYFSYNDLVAYENMDKLYIIKNTNGPITGRHLNDINPNKSIRISTDEFFKQVEKDIGTRKIKCYSYINASEIIQNNAKMVTIGKNTYYFSYERLIAASTPNGFKKMSNNSKTIRKNHLNHVAEFPVETIEDELFLNITRDLRIGNL